jgi:triosephosphate isomerase (TIM)
MRLPFIAGNWKMHKTVHESVVFVKEFRSMVKDIIDVEIVVAPPFTALHAVAEAARSSIVGVGAQSLYWEREGAFTGEISAAMLREAGAEYVIIGHSERRRLFHETDETVNRELLAALDAKLTAIVCIGETLEERERDETMAVLDRQIRVGLDGLNGEQIAGLVVAYEPVWAIGSGLTPTPADVAEMHGFIRRQLIARYGEAGQGMRILYGGSVKPSNAKELMGVADVDGALVGGASLKADEFLAIAGVYR